MARRPRCLAISMQKIGMMLVMGILSACPGSGSPGPAIDLGPDSLSSLDALAVDRAGAELETGVADSLGPFDSDSRPDQGPDRAEQTQEMLDADVSEHFDTSRDTDIAPDDNHLDIQDESPDEAETQATTTLSLTMEVDTAESATIVVEFTPARAGAVAQRWTTPWPAQPHIDLPQLHAGPGRLRAWLDLDGDAQWDGIWQSEGEPTALIGVEVPRTALTLPLRRGWPTVILEDGAPWVELYDAAWRLAVDHISAGTPANGFSHHYMDEGFSDQIFQWDTVFMTLFGRYALDAFPTMESLDNFYRSQQADGYICRVVNESDGHPGGTWADPAEPMINPPLFAWSEWLYARQSGDLARMPQALSVLTAYHDWLDDHVRTLTPDGTALYYTSMLGSGMDNAPRSQAYDGWVDITAQQALGRGMLAQMAAALGRDDERSQQQAEFDRICSDIRRLMWNSETGFFFDLDHAGQFLTDKTLAGIWPLTAGCADPEQVARVVDWLRNPAAFWRTHAFASTAADSPFYDPQGYYWRGGVWAPTNYATIAALSAAGYDEVARAATENHLNALYRVFADFVPRAEQFEGPQLPELVRNTLWELYAPDIHRPGTRWDGVMLGKPDFVGWTGLGPIALLLEQIIGLQADALDDRLTWRLTRTDRHGVSGYRFGDQLVDLVADARDNEHQPATIHVTSSDAFVLVVQMSGQAWTFEVQPGSSTFQVDPAGSPVVNALGPAGPFAGYAVLGNGHISAAYSDAVQPADPPGIAHLYVGNFGLDLLEAGRTHVIFDGAPLAGGSIGLDPFFAAYREHVLPDGGRIVWRAFVGEADAVVIEGALGAGPTAVQLRVVPHLQVRMSPAIDGDVQLEQVGLDNLADGLALWARFSDQTALAFGAEPIPVSWQAGSVPATNLVSGLSQTISEGNELALQLELQAAAGAWQPFRWVVSVGTGTQAALDTLHSILQDPAPLETAADFWRSWAPEQLCSAGALCTWAAANLYAARASSLDGQVPADLTGQFVTNGHPQLYPRDALMVARALNLAGHPTESWQIVRDWLDHERLGPALDGGSADDWQGAWYARYDALGRAVDAGTGADYDVPEWDSNGYLAVLVEDLGPDGLDPAQREKVLLALDWLVAKQDDDGLWREGGIIEWIGRLPASAMAAWAGLDAGARLADRWSQPTRAVTYRAAAGRLRAGLQRRLFDLRRLTLADEREGGLLYNTSVLFGPAWGYPAGPLQDATWRWTLAEATALGGGVRYFESPEGHPASGYGQDLFYFTTAAAVRYALTVGQRQAAEPLFGWLQSFTSRYGLAPERIFADGSGAAPAAPLSWCLAELATTVLAWIDPSASEPLVDGYVGAAEYRAKGTAIVDSDGQPDIQADPVVLYAMRDAATLYLGLQLAGETDALGPETRFEFYLSDAAGQGPVAQSEGGQRLDFRTNGISEDQPGALARILVAFSPAHCVAGRWRDGEFDDQTCLQFGLGNRAVEVRINLDALEIFGPVQVILATVKPDAETLLPSGGALQTDEAPNSILVTFEVDATAAMDQIQPSQGRTPVVVGDRAELGNWDPTIVLLYDDATHGDRFAGDRVWSRTVRLAERGSVQYKYVIRNVAADPWQGVEFSDDNRRQWVQDPDETGRVRIHDHFGVHGGELYDW